MRTLIVGGGPAGSCAAISLLSLDKDADVTILTRNLGMSPVRCGGGLSTYIQEKTGLTLPREIIGSYIRTVRIYSPNSDYWELDWTSASIDHMGYILHRDKHDQWLLAEASKKGAHIYEKNVTKPFLRGISYNVLVGADGASSIVADFAGRPSIKRGDLHHGIQITTSWKEYPNDVINLYFGNKIAPQGYAWIFPCANTVRIGLAIPLSARKNVGKLLTSFLAMIEAPTKGILISKLIPTALPPKTGLYGNVLLVGDALPACDPVTGGGIGNAVFSGVAAGRAIAENNIAKYDCYWKRSFYWRSRLRYSLKNMLYECSDRDLNKLVHVLKRFQIKSGDIGKELARALTYLAVKEPSLLFRKAAEGFLRESY